MYFWGPYLLTSCNFYLIKSAMLDEALYMKGYLLKVLNMSRYSFPWCVKKSVVKSCHRPLGMSQQSIGSTSWVILYLVHTVHLFSIICAVSVC